RVLDSPADSANLGTNLPLSTRTILKGRLAMKFMQRSLMGLFLLALTLGLLALAAGSVRTSLNERWSREATSRPARERVFAVNVIVATRADIVPKIVTFGEIRSKRTLDLRAPINGTVIELSEDFVEGGRVSKGDLLIRLDPANAQSALDLATADAQDAVAELAEARAALLLATDEVDAAKEQSKLRKAALKRQEDLRTRGVGTEAAVETAALAYASSNQAVLGKRQSLAQVNARITRAASSVARQDVRLAETRRRLNDTEIYAEFDGVISSVSLVSGGLVGTNEKLARLIDPSALEVAFRISNSQFSRLLEAKQDVVRGDVLVKLDILGEDITTKGSIDRVSAEVGEGQTGRQIFASLATSAAVNLRPGDFVSVEVDEPVQQGVALLPASAVDASGVVLVLGENDRLEELQITVLRKQGDQVIVRAEGLFDREVVEARSPLLGAGIKVKPLRRDNSSASVAIEPKAPKMIKLSQERRAKLTAFIENNALIPKNRKDVILARLKKDEVPEEMVNRIESRMGG
ncbi:MAG: multidrug resistance efflux pump, partial [Planctomycetota bacterium]